METFYEKLTALVSQWDMAFTRKSELEEMLEKNPKPTKPELINGPEEYEALSSAMANWAATTMTVYNEIRSLEQKIIGLEFDIKSIFKAEDLRIWFCVKSASGNTWGVKVKADGSGLTQLSTIIMPWKEVMEEYERYQAILNSDY